VKLAKARICHCIREHGWQDIQTAPTWVEKMVWNSIMSSAVARSAAGGGDVQRA